MKISINVFIYTLTILLSSCSQERIQDLEFENRRLENKISDLTNEKDDMLNRIYELEQEISNMHDDMKEIQRFARKAKFEANSAVDWAKSGNEFLFRCSIDDMTINFNNIVHIAEKY